MSNPVAVERVTHNQDGPIYRSVYTWCPGCQNAHPFRVELYPGCPPRSDGSTEPTWEWDGNLEVPTFSPSMLAYYAVHLCEGEHPPVPCPDTEACSQVGHLLVDGVPHDNTPHTRDPAWGNCHSFLRAGQWEFLGDSGHRLAGQTVPMVPLPDYLATAKLP